MKLVCTESGFAVGVQSLFLVFKSVVSHFTPLYFGVCVCCISTTTRIFSAHVIRFKKKTSDSHDCFEESSYRNRQQPLRADYCSIHRGF